jgi:DNA adenine methylase
LIKSPIKWAGGKSKSLHRILPELTGKRLLEPFLGSSVVSLNVSQEIILANDFNKDLIFLFNAIKNDLKELTEYIEILFRDGNRKEYYLNCREEFNRETNDIKRAAYFVYLNRHCFNGLCRYNSKGGFNVPFGKYSTITPPIKELVLAHEEFSRKDITFFNLDFLEFLEKSLPGDVVYCDPPYSPISETTFVNYSGNGFEEKLHEQLARRAEELSENGVKVLISNHDTPFTRELYKNAKRILEIDVQRSISNNSDGRKKVKEIIAIYER